MLVKFKKKEVIERKIFYDEIYEDKIRSIQKFEDEDISERYTCLYDYFLDHEDIISQRSTFDFSNEWCFDKSNLDRVAKRLLPKGCRALFPVFTKGDGNCLFNSISLLLTGEQSQLSTGLRIKVVGEMIKNTRNRYWFRKWLGTKPFCSFDPRTTHSCKTKWNSTNTKKVRHYKLFR